MARKGFLVKVELDIQKITCPGVWLCTNGKVLLQIHMLDSSTQTSGYKPIFPIRCYEKFVFHKIFCDERRLNDLQRSLNNEWFYVELIQKQDYEDGCVLARFRTTLDDLLYPTSFRGSITGMEIDLLMEPTKLFPGTLAPKLEVSTKTTVEETICELNHELACLEVVNPKFMLSGQAPQQRKSHPTRVCHSVAFSRRQNKIPAKEKKTRPIFQYRKVDEDLIQRNNPNVVKCYDPETIAARPRCHCYCKSRSMENIPRRSKFVCRRISPENMPTNHVMCNCADCPICSKYEGYFSSNAIRMKHCVDNCLHPDNYKPINLCQHCKDVKFRARSTNHSLHGSDSSYNSDKRICFCLPAERTSGLAQRLHEKLVKTIDSNRRFFDDCTVCQNVN